MRLFAIVHISVLCLTPFTIRLQPLIFSNFSWTSKIWKVCIRSSKIRSVKSKDPILTTDCSYHLIFSSRFSYLVVNFKDDKYFVTKLSESSDFNSFISSVGSLIHLFMGASLLSFIELLYYVTIHSYVAYRANQRMQPDFRIDHENGRSRQPVTH